MASEEITVDSLIAMLGGDGHAGHAGNTGRQEKLAFSRGDVADASSTELFQKLSAEMDADEVLKQAAHAKLSGAIMSEAILEKLSAHFGPSVAKMAADAAANAVGEKLAALLPQVVAAVVPHAVQIALEKIAVGTSSTITGNTQSSKPNPGSATAQQHKEDEIGRSGKGKIESWLHNDGVEGAQVVGSPSPEGGAGVKPPEFEPIGKVAAAKSKAREFLFSAEKQKLAFLQKHASGPLEQYGEAVKQAEAYMRDALGKAEAYVKQAELEADLARYQELEAKAASGMLSPEEKQELEMLRNKLMAAAGQGGAPGGAPMDAGGGGAAGAGGPPPGSMGSFGDGTAPSEPKTAAEKLAAVNALIARYLPNQQAA